MNWRKSLILAGLACLVAAPVFAQVEYTGTLRVTVVGEDGGAVSGSAVNVVGSDYTRSQTTDSNGKVRFIKLAPGKYHLEVLTSGYNTTLVENIEIETLANPEMIVTISKSTLEEKIVVTAETPLIDRRKVGTSTVLNQDEISQIPTSRDPWAVLSTIPGVTTDRVNVGGNESGQQSTWASKGGDGSTATWVMDGVEFTDNAAEGASSTYLDFNSFEQIGFVSGGADVEQSTPGLRLNFVTKQGSNRHTGTIRMLFADDDTQSSIPTYNNPASVVAAGGDVSFSGNGINEVFEKNFDIGGPILKDQLWYWVGYTQNDIDANVGGTPDRTKLQNLSLKVHGTATEGRTNYKAMWTQGDKRKDGRGAGATRTSPTTWDQDGPSPIYNLSLSHFFSSDLEVSGQWGRVDGGFNLKPKGGTDTQIHLDENGVWRNTYFDYRITRPTESYTARANYFVDGGGWEHELKFGFRFKETERQTISTYGGGVVSFSDDGFDGSANLYRDGLLRDETEHLNLWAGNTMVKGPWAVTYGFNYSQQEGKQVAANVGANALLDAQAPGTFCGADLCADVLPGLSAPSFDPGVEWEDFLPRIGATYTFDRAKRILLRASYSQFVDQLSNGEIAFSNPVAPAYLAYAWQDLNDNDLVSIDELDFSATLATSNIDPANPGALTYVNAIDPDLDSPTVESWVFGAEYELAKNFSLSGALTFNKREDELFRLLFDESALDGTTGRFTGPISTLFGSSAYDCTTTVTGTNPLTGAPFSEPVCTLNAAAAAQSTLRGAVMTNYGGMDVNYEGLEFTATKRLSNNWMLRGFLTLNNWERDFSGEPISNDRAQCNFQSNNIDGDPTNLEGGLAADGSAIGIQSCGSGNKRDIWVGTARWQGNVNFLYQLPRGFSVSANVQGREGYAIPSYYQDSFADADGTEWTKKVQIGDVEDERYDDLFVFDLKLGKTFRMEGNTVVELSLEGFNLLDDDVVLQQGRRINSVPPGNPAEFGAIREGLSPRIWRYGATITF